jgi:predicted ATPase/class 3 adenylate cyclase/DNA-binding CsgD family transcriptional regulator
MSTPSADTPPVNWGDLGVVGILPTGTVTLLLADVEGSTRLWESQPEEMRAAIARQDATLAELTSVHHGVRPVEQGEGDSFVVAFSRASDAVACALDLQRAPLAPIRLRVGVHTGEIQLRDEGNYIGPTINRTARLRDLAHGGQTVISGTTHDLVVDRLPAGAWLTELGTQTLRDLPRPERVVQLCHPDIVNDFPPLRVSSSGSVHRLPAELTTFVGREAEMAKVCALLEDNRLVTLTGAGGSGKTRLAVQVATRVTADFADGLTFVDLAPITHDDLLAVTTARALSLPDQPGRSPAETVLRFVADRHMLMVLDNCEHLLDASAVFIETLLAECSRLVLLTTSREPIGVASEATWRVPSLSLDREAIDLFTDRARKVRPEFTVTEANLAAVTEICHRLDGMPLAIELAAARMRALSVEDIVGSLHDRFRLLTGGARTAVRRQQTLRASVDWSHALLTEPERTLFRRLAAFAGGFDLAAAEAVGGGGDVEHYQVLDQLTLLVDKSLVVVESVSGPTRYRLLETVRQYAMEKLGESGEAEVVRSRHRDHFMSLAAALDRPEGSVHEQHLDQAELEIDNLRSAFAWSLENDGVAEALTLASSLQPLWLARGQVREGLKWLESSVVNAGAGAPEAARVRALADKALLSAWVGGANAEQAEEALTIARELDDPALLARALTANGCIRGHNARAAEPYFTEAIGLARASSDSWLVSQILGWQAYGAMMLGDPTAALEAGEKGRAHADAIGDRFVSRQCRWCVGLARLWRGDLNASVAQFEETADEAQAAHDLFWVSMNRASQGYPLAYKGQTAAAELTAEKALEACAEIRGLQLGYAYWIVALTALACGDIARAREADDLGVPLLRSQPETQGLHQTAEIALAEGDLDRARHWADEAIATTIERPCHAMHSLTTRARVAIAENRLDYAEDCAHQALGHAASVASYLGVPDILECLAGLADDDRESARLFGAAEAVRKDLGIVRFKVHEAAYHHNLAMRREAMGESDFDTAWAEGAALTIEEAIAYAQRGRGERKRPSRGWPSLTPTELDVARLVRDGLANKAIATRLFISPRTVQTHLTHIYTKLGITSRVQLAQEAAKHE